MKRYLPIFVASLLLLLLVLGGIYILMAPKALHIAFIGPMSGETATNGKHQVQGIKLLLDQINAKGGINGKKIVLDVYDDQNNSTICKQKALEVATNSQALAVIGHNYSSCSISAGPVYQEHGLLAVSPSSTNVKVTRNNDWYFRTIFNNDQQARFLANYAHSVLNAENVTIIRQDVAYGQQIAKVFAKTATSLGINTESIFNIKTTDSNVDSQVATIMQKLQAEASGIDALLIATRAAEGIKIVKQLKDQGLTIPVITPDTFDSELFINGFKRFPKEQSNPRHYTNGILVASPVIFDNANHEAQNFKLAYYEEYGEETDWRAARRVRSTSKNPYKNNIDILD